MNAGPLIFVVGMAAVLARHYYRAERSVLGGAWAAIGCVGAVGLVAGLAL